MVLHKYPVQVRVRNTTVEFLQRGTAQVPALGNILWYTIDMTSPGILHPILFHWISKRWKCSPLG